MTQVNLLTPTEALETACVYHHFPVDGSYVDLPFLVKKLEEYGEEYDEDTDQYVYYGWSFHDGEKSELEEIPAVGETKDLYITSFFGAGTWVEITRVSDRVFQLKDLE